MTDITHPLPACPRCNGKWDPSSFEFKLSCDKCGINYYTAPTIIIWHPVIQDNHRLAWRFNSGECAYGTPTELAFGHATILPWLDFKISFDKLKLYLVFS